MPSVNAGSSGGLAAAPASTSQSHGNVVLRRTFATTTKLLYEDGHVEEHAHLNAAAGLSGTLSTRPRGGVNGSARAAHKAVPAAFCTSSGLIPSTARVSASTSPATSLANIGATARRTHRGSARSTRPRQLSLQSQRRVSVSHDTSASDARRDAVEVECAMTVEATGSPVATAEHSQRRFLRKVEDGLNTCAAVAEVADDRQQPEESRRRRSRVALASSPRHNDEAASASSPGAVSARAARVGPVVRVQSLSDIGHTTDVPSAAGAQENACDINVVEPTHSEPVALASGTHLSVAGASTAAKRAATSEGGAHLRPLARLASWRITRADGTVTNAADAAAAAAPARAPLSARVTPRLQQVQALRQSTRASARRPLKAHAPSMLSIALPDISEDGMLWTTEPAASHATSSATPAAGTVSPAGASGHDEGPAIAPLPPTTTTPHASLPRRPLTTYPDGATPCIVYERIVQRERGAMHTRLSGLDAQRFMHESPEASTVALLYFWFVVLRSRRSYIEHLLEGRYRLLHGAYKALFPRRQSTRLPSLDALQVMAEELLLSAEQWEVEEEEAREEQAVSNAFITQCDNVSTTATAAVADGTSARGEGPPRHRRLDVFYRENGYTTLANQPELLRAGEPPAPEVVWRLITALDAFTASRDEYQLVQVLEERCFHGLSLQYGRLFLSLTYQKDFILESYEHIVAHITNYALLFNFINDAHGQVFNDDFRVDLFRLFHYWCSGLSVTHVPSKHWPLPLPEDVTAAFDAEQQQLETKEAAYLKGIVHDGDSDGEQDLDSHTGNLHDPNADDDADGVHALKRPGRRASMPDTMRPSSTSATDCLASTEKSWEGDAPPRLNSLSASGGQMTSSSFRSAQLPRAATAVSWRSQHARKQLDEADLRGGEATARAGHGDLDESVGGTGSAAPMAPFLVSSTGGGGGASVRGDCAVEESDPLAGAAALSRDVHPSSRRAAHSPTRGGARHCPVLLSASRVEEDPSGASTTAISPACASQSRRPSCVPPKRAKKANRKVQPLQPLPGEEDFDELDIEVANGEYRLISKFERYAQHANHLMEELERRVRRQHHRQVRKNNLVAKTVQQSRQQQQQQQQLVAPDSDVLIAPTKASSPLARWAFSVPDQLLRPASAGSTSSTRLSASFASSMGEAMPIPSRPRLGNRNASDRPKGRRAPHTGSTATAAATDRSTTTASSTPPPATGSVASTHGGEKTAAYDAHASLTAAAREEVERRNRVELARARLLLSAPVSANSRVTTATHTHAPDAKTANAISAVTSASLGDPTVTSLLTAYPLAVCEAEVRSFLIDRAGLRYTRVPFPLSTYSASAAAVLAEQLRERGHVSARSRLSPDRRRQTRQRSGDNDGSHEDVLPGTGSTHLERAASFIRSSFTKNGAAIRRNQSFRSGALLGSVYHPVSSAVATLDLPDVPTVLESSQTSEGRLTSMAGPWRNSSASVANSVQTTASTCVTSPLAHRTRGRKAERGGKDGGAQYMDIAVHELPRTFMHYMEQQQQQQAHAQHPGHNAELAASGAVVGEGGIVGAGRSATATVAHGPRALLPTASPFMLYYADHVLHVDISGETSALTSEASPRPAAPPRRVAPTLPTLAPAAAPASPPAQVSAWSPLRLAGSTHAASPRADGVEAISWLPTLGTQPAPTRTELVSGTTTLPPDPPGREVVANGTVYGADEAPRARRRGAAVGAKASSHARAVAAAAARRNEVETAAQRRRGIAPHAAVRLSTITREEGRTRPLVYQHLQHHVNEHRAQVEADLEVLAMRERVSRAEYQNAHLRSVQALREIMSTNATKRYQRRARHALELRDEHANTTKHA